MFCRHFLSIQMLPVASRSSLVIFHHNLQMLTVSVRVACIQLCMVMVGRHICALCLAAVQVEAVRLYSASAQVNIPA